jgi:hypothetical protein
MSEPENFLSRWSRRKREAAEPAPDAADEVQQGAARDVSAPPRASGDPGPESPASRSDVPAAAQEKRGAQADPEFDISKLPPIESITAETDIRAFLAPGVPPALTQAALRRAWVADPKIRDFIEVAENQWDFTAPGVPGFDLSPPTGDVARMASDILRGVAGESPAQPAAASAEREIEAGMARETSVPASSSHRIVNEPAVGSARHDPAVEKREVVSPANGEREQQVAALQKDDAPQNDGEKKRRRIHGRAIPR